ARGRGGPRSEGPRRTILEVARRAFASRGYEQTTIRTVAAEAGIDAAMVMRYFGSKAGLFAAAATPHLHAPDLTQTPARARGEHLVRHFVERWESSPDDDSLVFLLRTAVTNEAVAQQMQQRLSELIVKPIDDAGVDHAARRGALIATQMLGVALCRYVLGFQPIASAPAAQV